MVKASNARDVKQLLEQRDVLSLRAGGFEWDEIADRLGISERAAKQQYRKAVAEARAEIDDLAIAVVISDLKLLSAIIEGLKERLVRGDPVACDKAMKAIAHRLALFKRDDDEPDMGGRGGNLTINFVRERGANDG